jgi:dolichyl-phosphate beta-glucosyltransferase
MTPAPPEAAPALTVIIPAYNEQQRLPQHLGHVLAYLREHYPSFELLVVDDGSRDSTAEAVRAALAGEPRARVLAYQPNRGKGYAIRHGIQASRGARVVFLDADLSTPIEEIPRALEQLQQADVVIGSRDLPSSSIRVQQPLFRRLASEIFKWARYLMVGLWRLSDTQCGFKAYRGPLARQLFALAQVDRFMFDVEILYLADRAGLRIVEMPVQWQDAPGSKVRFWAGLRDMVRDLWRIRRLHGHRQLMLSS